MAFQKCWVSANLRRVSESRRLKIVSRNLGFLEIWRSLGVSDFENLDLKISPMGRSIFYPQAYPKREIKKFTPAGICIYNCYVKYI